MHIEQEGAGCVGGVGDMKTAPAQAPRQPGIDGTECQFPLFGPGAQSRNRFQQPQQLRPGEIRVEHEAGALPDFTIPT